MNKKELESLLPFEESNHDVEEKEVYDLKEKIDRMLNNLNELSPEEKVIMEKIQKVLEEHEIKYSYDEDEPKHIGLEFSMENKPFKIYIILQNGKVIFRLSFPFRVQTNAYPLMCMFMAEFNENKAFSLLNLDPDDGELTMEYSYMLENPEHFDEKYFVVYMFSLIHPALDIYTKLAHLSMGMVSRKNKRLYKKMLEMALETVNGDFDDENISYGTESLKFESLPVLSSLFSGENDDSDKDDSVSDDRECASDFIQRLRGRRRLSRFDEFMRMRGQAEEKNEEEENEEQPKMTSGTLSMFAKRDEDKDFKVGGNEDE